MRTLLLALCLLSLFACVKRPAPPAPVAAEAPVLPEFAEIDALYKEFEGFRNDRLFLQHGFTANFPRALWLQKVQRLEGNPDLAERANLLASLAVATRIHGDGSKVTRRFEERLDLALRTPGPVLPPNAEQDAGEADIDASVQAATVQLAALEPASAQDGLGPETHNEPAGASPAVETTPPALQAGEIPAQLPTEQRGAIAPVPSQDAPAPESQNVPAPPAADTTQPALQAEEIPAQPQTEQQGAITPASSGPAQPASATPDRMVPAPTQEARQARQSATGDIITLLFTGDTQGVVYPQPGIAGSVGGLARRPPVIDRMREKDPGLLLLDAGDAFTSGFPRADHINKTLARAMNRMGYDAMSLGRHDMETGEAALRELAGIASFPLICSNLEFRDGTPSWIKRYVIFERENRRIAVVGILSPESPIRITGASLIAPPVALRQLLPQLKAKTDAIVLMTQEGSQETLRMIGNIPGVDVILGDGKARAMDSPLYVPAVPKGLGMGMVQLQATGGKYRDIQTIPLLATGKVDNNILLLMDKISE